MYVGGTSRKTGPKRTMGKDMMTAADAVRESGGLAIAVTANSIATAVDEVACTEGFLMCLEGAATYAAHKQSRADGCIGRNDRTVLFNCATGLKYPLPPVHRTLGKDRKIDFPRF
jgi:threonine synthase